MDEGSYDLGRSYSGGLNMDEGSHVWGEMKEAMLGWEMRGWSV